MLIHVMRLSYGSLVVTQERYLVITLLCLQMPGVDQMQGYNMRYGRSPVMELPLAINPSGCARSEPLLRTHFKRYDFTELLCNVVPVVGHHGRNRENFDYFLFADMKLS